MNDENELLEPLATEAGQEAIVRAIRDISSLEYAVRAEQAASQASAKAGEASQSALEASEAEDKAKDWATKTDGYVEQETITIPPAQEGEEPTTETINLYSARYYAALAQDIYNNMSFDSVPTENSTNMVSSGTVYSALDLKADKSTTYTKTEVDTALSAKADQSTTYTKTEVDTALGNVQSTLTFDNVPTANSDNPVKSSGIKTALDGKQDTLTFDSTPTANSTNPVTSGGIYTALQNVNIDIDDEITEDSDNPVTSAAIYEALQNFTPSGGDSGGAGNASGVVVDSLYKDDNGINGVNSQITLNNSFKNYDFLVILTGHPSESPLSSEPRLKTFFYLVSKIKENQDFSYGFDSAGRYGNLKFTTDTTAIFTQSNTEKVYEIKGVKFSKNLSEQMYSNVLYENSNLWSSGSVVLSDTIDNYDFLCFETTSVGYTQFSSQQILRAAELLDTSHTYFNLYENGSRSFEFTVSSDKKTLNCTRTDQGLRVRKIIGIKLAKGGYSGIVSDARMTVKSGTVEFDSTVGSYSTATKDVVFDSPMPDDNYVVFTERVFEGNHWPFVDETIKNKTQNGFTIFVYNSQNGTTGSKPKFNWLAIRPNSYTREGMVEDVLYTTSTGFTTGTINLSGNISDYDLIEFVIGDSTDGEKFTSNHVYSSSVLTNIMGQQNKFFYLVYYGGGWQMISVDSDNQLSCSNRSGNTVLYKIIGIKFGRYVSGVAVDTTVTRNSNAVVTSGAVYDALQNIPSGGGGSGGNIVLDSTPTENSTNGVTSGGVYEALHPSMESRIPNDMKVNTANQVLFVDGGRTQYKKYDGVAASVVANAYRNLHAVIVSDNVDAVKGYSSYNTNDVSTVSTLIYAGKQFYYSNIPYGWDKSDYSVTSSNIRIIQNLFNSDEQVARYILDILYPELASKKLEDYNIKDVYTKEEIYNILYKTNKELDFPFLPIPEDMRVMYAGTMLFSCGGRNYYKRNNGRAAGALCKCGNNNNLVAILIAETSDAVIQYSSYNFGVDSTVYNITRNGKTYYFTSSPYGMDNPSSFSNSIIRDLTSTTFTDSEDAADYILDNILLASNYSLSDYSITDAYTKTEVDTLLQNAGGSSITVDSTITQGGTNPVEGGAIYTALANKGDVTTNTDQNITGTKTFVGSKKVAFKQSTTNDKLGFTLFGNTGTERCYLEFNPTNTVDGVAGLMTLGNYATSAASLTQVGFRRYSNISGQSGAYNLLMPMVADARTPFSLTTSYQNFYLPLGFTDGTTTVKTAKSGLVDLSPIIQNIIASANNVSNANGVSY